MSPMKQVTIHARRWQVVVAFLAVLVAAIYGLLLVKQDVNANHRHIIEMQAVNRQLVRNNRDLTRIVRRLGRDKASIVGLETTNCKLRAFMLTAAAARRATAMHDPTAAAVETDRKAASAYEALASSLRNQLCRG